MIFEASKIEHLIVKTRLFSASLKSLPQQCSEQEDASYWYKCNNSMKIHPTLLKFVSWHIAPQDTWTRQIRKNTFFVLCRTTRYETRQNTKYKVNKTSNFVLWTLFAHMEWPQGSSFIPGQRLIWTHPYIRQLTDRTENWKQYGQSIVVYRGRSRLNVDLE